MILVTKPFLAPIEEINSKIAEVWNNGWITNDGPFLKSLEREIANYLHSTDLVAMNNGTITLQIAMKALNIKKRNILTTPFSYVASTSSIVWEMYNPIFVDICSDTLNVDASLVEDYIDDSTGAMLFTHVFGNACDLEKLQKISNIHNVPLIYDSAHAFGVKFDDKSIFNFGTISSCSFHATKLFHTVEGGALFSSNKDLLNKCNLMKKFGHEGPTSFNGVGINGKLSEVHAAIGLVNLDYMDAILIKRKQQYLAYKEILLESKIEIGFQKIDKRITYNFSYFPIIFNNEEKLLNAISLLEKNSIFPRRYFYPSLNMLDYVTKQSCPVAEDISRRILCLPLYHELTLEEVTEIANLVIKSQTT